jgi:hypothetical protein
VGAFNGAFLIVSGDPLDLPAGILETTQGSLGA